MLATPNAIPPVAARAGKPVPKEVWQASQPTAIAAELAALGHVEPSGQAYHAGSIRHMLA